MSSIQDMIASASAEFEGLVLDAGVSFDDFGNATQGDLLLRAVYASI
jgi:hypothetical protein